MKATSVATGLVLALIQQSLAAFGPALRTTTTASDAWIEEAVATLILGNAPSPMTGDVALWTGLLTDKDDFLQGIAENSLPNGGYGSRFRGGTVYSLGCP
jgi:hypothetical protein